MSVAGMQVCESSSAATQGVHQQKSGSGPKNYDSQISPSDSLAPVPSAQNPPSPRPSPQFCSILDGSLEISTFQGDDAS